MQPNDTVITPTIVIRCWVKSILQASTEKKTDVGEGNAEVQTGVNESQDVLIKKEAYWVTALILIGLVVFYVTYTGGYMFIIPNNAT